MRGRRVAEWSGIERLRRAAVSLLTAGICVGASMAAAQASASDATAVPVAGASASFAETGAAILPVAAHTDANAWLSRIDRAARQETYEGTFIYQRGGSFQSSKIVHYLDHGTEYERVEGLDGRPTRTLRKNDDVYTFVPDRKLVVVDRRSSKYTFPALLAGDPAKLLDVYDVRPVGDDRVAGYDAQVIELQPKDAFRFAFRLWFDKKTGLLLRAQTLDDKNQVIEQIAFSQLSFNVLYEHRTVANGIHDTAGWSVVHPPIDTVDMAAEGWQVPPVVAGFHAIRELRRPMAAREQGAPPVQVDQAVYSDGLSAVSVFVEPVGKSDRKEGVASSGATHILVRKSGDFWITVVGEVPQPTLDQFASAIVYKAPK